MIGKPKWGPFAEQSGSLSSPADPNYEPAFDHSWEPSTHAQVHTPEYGGNPRRIRSTRSRVESAMSKQSDAALYELARDLIADRMALVSSHIWRERRKVNRDDALCSKLQELNTRLFLERDSLSSLESVLLEACIRRNARSLDGANVAIAAIYEFHQGEGSDSPPPAY